MTVQSRPLSEINRRGIAALIRELGVADALRFISQYSTGEGDYTTERKRWLEELSLDDVIAEARRLEQPGNDSGDDR